MTSIERERNFFTEPSHRQIVAYLQNFTLRITTENLPILHTSPNLNFQVNYFHPIIKYIDVHNSTMHKFHSGLFDWNHSWSIIMLVFDCVLDCRYTHETAFLWSTLHLSRNITCIYMNHVLNVPQNFQSHHQRLQVQLYKNQHATI